MSMDNNDKSVGAKKLPLETIAFEGYYRTDSSASKHT